VGNNPVNRTDPSGHCEESDGKCRDILAKTLPKVPAPTYGDGLIGPPAPPAGPPFASSNENDSVPQFECNPNYELCLPEQINENDVWQRPEDTDPGITFPWEISRLNAVGFRYDIFSLWLLIIGGDISVDVIYNWGSQETILFLNLSVMDGLGLGADNGAGVVLVYDSAFNRDISGYSTGGQLSGVYGEGLQGSYSISDSPGFNGNAQQYFLGIAGGVEASGGATRTLTIPIFTITRCTFGGCNK
jgi:hypothetical protein